jgi:hypothetical protein
MVWLSDQIPLISATNAIQSLPPQTSNAKSEEELQSVTPLYGIPLSNFMANTLKHANCLGRREI